MENGQPCELNNRSPRQCEADTNCVYRARDTTGPVCGCDNDHFFNGERCVRRMYGHERIALREDSARRIAITFLEDNDHK